MGKTWGSRAVINVKRSVSPAKTGDDERGEAFKKARYEKATLGKRGLGLGPRKDCPGERESPVLDEIWPKADRARSEECRSDVHLLNVRSRQISVNERVLARLRIDRD